MRAKNGKLETAAQAKSRVKRFEKHNTEGCNHRLALTYASNQPGETPPNPSYMKTVDKRHKEGMSWIGQKLDSLDKAVNPFRQAGDAMREAAKPPTKDIGQKAYEDAVNRGKR